MPDDKRESVRAAKLEQQAADAQAEAKKLVDEHLRKFVLDLDEEEENTAVRNVRDLLSEEERAKLVPRATPTVPNRVSVTHEMSPRPRGKGERILVVDDDRDIREMLAEALKAEGFSVYTANDGWEAAIAVTENPLLDLVLLDMLMPRVNGAEFVAWLTRSPWSQLPVLIITAAKPPVDEHDYRFVFTKPLDFGLLLEAVVLAIAEYRGGK